jgi:hypothetical protein
MALSSASRVNAADITIQYSDGWGRIFVDIVGEIAAGDDKVFEQRVAEKIDLPNLIIVSLSSPGGDSRSAINIGEFIHNHGWSTYVPSGTVCASGCATIWLAGDHRLIEGAPGVHIGFHAVYDAGTKKETGTGNAILGSHLARWGFDDRAITCVTVTPPDQIGWLSGPDGSQYHLGGLGTSPLPSNEILAACANEGGTTANTLGQNPITSLFSTRPPLVSSSNRSRIIGSLRSESQNHLL